MDVFVARQPIFDQQRHVIAYELLYRTGEQNSMYLCYLMRKMLLLNF